MSTQPAPHRVVVHVGAPKSGTTFLQRTLWSQRDELREVGFTCPGATQREMFHAAIEVRESFAFWGQDPEALRGTWARLCQEARDFGGTTIMSHELLAAATAEQAARALAELDGLDVHVVYTARDLARQVMSEWQERVKNGSTESFADFQRSVSKHLRAGGSNALFWRYHSMLDVLDRWAARVPPAAVHVVPAPPSGADPSVLWHRFGEAVGLDARRFDPPPEKEMANQSLGVAQIAALRRVNAALDGRIPQPGYGRVVKRQFSQRILVRHGSARPVCPAELVTELRELADRVNESVRERGYSVHGELDDLVPVPPAAGSPHPDDVSPEDERQTLATVVADLLVDRARSEPRGRPAGHRAAIARVTVGPVRTLARRIRAGLRRRRGVAFRRAARS
jgi:hypothetical protein